MSFDKNLPADFQGIHDPGNDWEDEEEVRSIKDVQINLLNKPKCDCQGGEIAGGAHFANCSFLRSLSKQELILFRHATIYG